eukprot:754678-Pelagomonas_calceolata.AAC.7
MIGLRLLPGKGVYSINPFEGVSALYDPSTSDDEVLPRYGVTAASETMVGTLTGLDLELMVGHNCLPQASWLPLCKPYKGKGCVKIRESQVGPGVGSVMYVQIHNETETGDAKHRQEFFAATELDKDERHMVLNENETGGTKCKQRDELIDEDHSGRLVSQAWTNSLAGLRLALQFDLAVVLPPKVVLTFAKVKNEGFENFTRVFI